MAVLEKGANMDWYSVFLLGNVIADAAIGIFAYKTGIFDPSVEKLKERLRYLKMLDSLIHPIVIINKEKAEEIREQDPLVALSDEFMREFDKSIFSEDRTVLLHEATPVPFRRAPSNMEYLKTIIYHNRHKIPHLIERAGNEYNRVIEGGIKKFLFNNMLWMFLVGVTLQLVSWIYGVIDP